MSQSSKEKVKLRAVVIQRAGELSEIVQMLERLAVPVDIQDGASMPQPDEVSGAAVVIVTGSRLLDGATPNLTLWPRTVAVVDQASKTLVAHLNRVGAALVIRRPIHPRTLRLLLLHEIYRGPERRKRRRTLIGHPIRVGAGLFKQRATLLELSDSGARVDLPKAPKVGDKLSLLLGKELTHAKPLKLQAKVVRCARAAGEHGRGASEIGVAFVDPRRSGKAIASILDRFASGPASWNGKVDAKPAASSKDASAQTEAATQSTAAATATDSAATKTTVTTAVPTETDPEESARRLPPSHSTSLPPLRSAAGETERAGSSGGTPVEVDADSGPGPEAASRPERAESPEAAIDPPTPSDCVVESPSSPARDEAEAESGESSAVEPLDDDATESDASDDERRRDPRIPYDRRVVALGEEAARVLVGRDLSQGGMRIAANDTVDVGDTLRVALHCGTHFEPLIVLATARRDDGCAGIVLEFKDLSDGQREHLEKIIASSSPIQAADDEDFNARTGSVVMGEMLERVSRAEPTNVETESDIDAHLDSIFDTDEPV